ncbi:hypothetical protein GQ457_12G016350 [Hibiscus cannabinus]
MFHWLFFDHDRAVNYDGRTRPLLGYSMNQAIGDGTSFWHFFNTLSQIFQSREDNIKISVFERWFPEGYGPLLKLPFTCQEEFISRYEAPQLFRENIPLLDRSHRKGLTQIIKPPKSPPSSLCLRLFGEQSQGRVVFQVKRSLVADWSRLEPPLSPDYFGNSIHSVRAVTTGGELLGNCTKLWLTTGTNQCVISSMIGLLTKYGNELGLGKALTLRSGYANKFDGKISSYPGREGGASIDLEVCLPPCSMDALASDEEFMASVS